MARPAKVAHVLTPLTRYPPSTFSARVRMEAAIAEAGAKADAAAQQAQNWCASEIAKVDADLAIARRETQKRIVDAQTRRAAMIAESQGQVAAQVAQVTAEIERQKARVLQVQRQLDADVVQLAEAERQAREEKARGDAAAVIERGKAEAQALSMSSRPSPRPERGRATSWPCNRSSRC